MSELIQPVLSGSALTAEIASAQPSAGEVMIWWLGQSGYAIKTVSALWYVDLYLSEHLTKKYANTDKQHIRITASPVRGAELTDVMLVFASHKHSDHLDPGTLPDLFAASPDARLVLPTAIVDHAAGLGLDRARFVLTRGEETLRFGPLTVHSLPSAHPTFEYTEAQGYPFLGFIFEVDGLTIYHSGDTVVYDGLADRLRAYDIDIAFLPINGAVSPTTPPNMNIDEALALAQAIRPRLVIPHHYDMFTFNTADVGEFAHKAMVAAVPFAVLNPGERFTWRHP
jgi:L-ascorbate metabolism protein UlaG (beta-lactamase superfamily)